MSERLVVLCTVGGAEEAGRIARELVERRLAACVNILGGITSVYRWQGKTAQEPEHLMIAKTTADRFGALREAIAAIHPYEVPEILALPIAAGHEPYLAWLDRSVEGQ